MKTVVIFRRWTTGRVLALFPYEIATFDGLVSSYMQVGQHGGAHLWRCIASTKPASTDDVDVKELINELTRIGYDLEIRKRANYGLYQKALTASTMKGKS